MLREVVDSASGPLTALALGGDHHSGRNRATLHFHHLRSHQGGALGVLGRAEWNGVLRVSLRARGVLRISDISGHLRALGMPRYLPRVSVTSLLVAPIRHLEVGVGTIYLAREAGGGEFN